MDAWIALHTDWILTLLGSAITGIVTGAYFVGVTKSDIAALKLDRDELKRDMRQVVHELRNDLAGMAKANDVLRLESHLNRQDEKIEKHHSENSRRYDDLMRAIMSRKAGIGAE